MIMEMPIRYVEQGWQCPVCGKVHAPWVSGCDCHQYDVSSTSNLDWTHHSTNTLEQIMKGTYKPPKEDA